MDRSFKVAAVLTALMVVASLGAVELHPTLQASGPAPRLAAQVPSAFGTWKMQPSVYEQANLDVATDGKAPEGQPYDQVVMRDFGDGRGRTVMLALAYTEVEAQEVKTHRPEVCYPAQGYAIQERLPANLSAIPREGVGKPPLQGIRMLAGQRGRLEAVVFWVRTGDSFTDSGLRARMEIVSEGLKGRTTDGVLVRASSIIASPEEAPAAYASLEGFLHDLVAASPPDVRTALVR